MSPCLFCLHIPHTSQLPVLHNISGQISRCVFVNLVTSSLTMSPHASPVVGTLDVYHNFTTHMPTYGASLAAKEHCKYTFHSAAVFVFCILSKTASPLSVCTIFSRIVCINYWFHISIKADNYAIITVYSEPAVFEFIIESSSGLHI